MTRLPLICCIQIKTTKCITNYDHLVIQRRRIRMLITWSICNVILLYSCCYTLAELPFLTPFHLFHFGHKRSYSLFYIVGKKKNLTSLENWIVRSVNIIFSKNKIWTQLQTPNFNYTEYLGYSTLHQLSYCS